MKIGIVSPYYIDRYGGVQSLIIATRDELIKRGHEVKIIAPKPRRGGHNKSETDMLLMGASAEIRFKALSTTFPVSSVNPKSVDALLEQEKFDILHIHEPWAIGVANQMVQRADCPTIGTLHANWPDSIVYKGMGRAASRYFTSTANKLDILTAVSDEAGAYAHKAIKRDIVLVPNAIDLGFYHPEGVSKLKEVDTSRKTIAYVGRLEKRKGVIYLLKAYKELVKKHPDVQLLIAGSGPNGRSLKDYVKRHKLKNAKFLGFVSDDQKRQLLKTADVYCSPAMYGESFGIVLLEAMAMGTVVVAGNNPGYSSVMSGRGRLSLVDPISKLDLPNRLELMLYDNQLRKLWLDWAKEYVKQFDYSVITDSYEDLYKQVIKS